MSPDVNGNWLLPKLEAIRFGPASYSISGFRMLKTVTKFVIARLGCNATMPIRSIDMLFSEHATERGPDNCQCRVCRGRPIASRTSASRSRLASIFDLSFARPSWRQKMYEFEGSEHSIPWSQRFCFGGSSRRYKLAEYVSLPSPVREPFYSS